MGHENTDSFAGKVMVERKGSPDGVVVYIAIYSFDGGDRFHCFQDLDRTEVSGMPYLVCVAQMFCKIVAEVAMSIRYKGDFLDISKFLPVLKTKSKIAILHYHRNS